MHQCENCDKEYELKKNSSETQRFCSTHCRVDFHQKKKSIELKESRLNICETCGSEYRPCRTGSKFCSSKCKQVAYRQRVQVKAKPFTIECFRTPIDECPNESGLTDFFHSKLYINGIGFDRMVGIWMDCPEITEKVDICIYTRNEHIKRQKAVSDNEEWVATVAGTDPFFVMSKGGSDMICFKFDKFFIPYWIYLIIEVMNTQTKADNVGLSYREYKDCIEQLDDWERKRAIKVKAKATREAKKGKCSK
jgi:hypothetical protein